MSALCRLSLDSQCPVFTNLPLAYQQRKPGRLHCILRSVFQGLRTRSDTSHDLLTVVSNSSTVRTWTAHLIGFADAAQRLGRQLPSALSR